MSEWFKEHDWKSCVGLKLTGGSNPLLCAIKKRYVKRTYLFFIVTRKLEEDSRVGGVLREQNGLPTQASITTNSTANWTINNRPPGRAAKGENPLLCANKRAKIKLKENIFITSLHFPTP